MKAFAGVVLCFVMVFGPLIVPAAANQLSNFKTVFSTDFAMFGFGGMRGIGSGSITVSGVTGTVTSALLYWHGPTNSTDPNANASVTFNGTAITGTNIGLSSDNCWSFTNSQAYRADVTSLVTGNGAYTLSNFLKTDADINGVSLLVFFNDGNPANNRDIVIFDGNDSNQPNSYDPLGWSASLPGINYTSGTVFMRLIVSDGQSFTDNGVAINGNTILPAGGLNFQGDTLPNGPSASSTNGGLWDHFSSDITSLLTPGVNNLTLTSIDGSSDCLSLIAVIFDLPAGAAPGAPIVATPIPTMTEWGMIILVVLTGLGSVLYIRKLKRV